MELWFIYALLSALFAWFFSFSSKLSVEKNHNPNIVTFYSSIIAFGLVVVLVLFFPQEAYWNILLWFVAGFFNGCLYAITILTRIKSLKYIDTSIYFPVYKSIWPVLVVIIWIFIFSEVLSMKEIIWVILWIIVPILLIWRNRKSKKTRKWIYYLVIWLLFSIVTVFIAKLVVNYSIWSNYYIMFSFLFTALFTIYLNNRKKVNNKSISYSISKIKRVWIITWIMNFLSFYFFMKAIELWNNLWVIYTINSLYIIVPIILSILYYKEHFDFKKFLAILLTIVSLFFLK